MNATLSESFVSVSDFNQGKANKIFNNVFKNNREYVVIKNNKPSAVLISIPEYERLHKKIEAFAAVLEQISDMQLLSEAEKVVKNTKSNEFTDFEDLVKESGFNIEEIKRLSETVEIE